MSVKSAHLTADELNYLRKLFNASQASETTTPTSTPQLLLDSSATDTELLTQLTNAERLQLRVEQGSYVFDFKLCVERPPAGSPVALRFGYPTIIERYGTERAARIQPRQNDIRVIDKYGLLQAPRVHDISVTGLSLTDWPSTLTRPGRHQIHLQLQFAKTESVELEGQVIRINRDHSNATGRTLAVQFENTDATTQAILNRYIFLHHPKGWPEIESANRMPG